MQLIFCLCDQDEACLDQVPRSLGRGLRLVSLNLPLSSLRLGFYVLVGPHPAPIRLLHPLHLHSFPIAFPLHVFSHIYLMSRVFAFPTFPRIHFVPYPTSSVAFHLPNPDTRWLPVASLVSRLGLKRFE